MGLGTAPCPSSAEGGEPQPSCSGVAGTDAPASASQGARSLPNALALAARSPSSSSGAKSMLPGAMREVPPRAQQQGGGEGGATPSGCLIARSNQISKSKRDSCPLSVFLECGCFGAMGRCWGRLGARYGSQWSYRWGTSAWRGRGRPAPRQGERAGEAGRTTVGHCNERARPVYLFISWWISGPTYSLPHTEYLLGVGSTYGIYSVGTNVHVTTYCTRSVHPNSGALELWTACWRWCWVT